MVEQRRQEIGRKLKRVDGEGLGAHLDEWAQKEGQWEKEECP